MTKQRALILDIIRSDKCHHTAEEIFNIARKSLPGISLATVYNNLHALQRDRQIRRISGDLGSDRYDSSYIPHGHMLCDRCGMVWDFEIEGFADTLTAAVGRDFSSYELKVHCLCDSCRSREQGSRGTAE